MQSAERMWDAALCLALIATAQFLATVPGPSPSTTSASDGCPVHVLLTFRAVGVRGGPAPKPASRELWT